MKTWDELLVEVRKVLGEGWVGIDSDSDSEGICLTFYWFPIRPIIKIGNGNGEITWSLNDYSKDKIDLYEGVRFGGHLVGRGGEDEKGVWGISHNLDDWEFVKTLPAPWNSLQKI